MYRIRQICFTINSQWVLGFNLGCLWSEGAGASPTRADRFIWFSWSRRWNIGKLFSRHAAKTIIIGALLPDPDIWILDEPLQGLDPQAAFDLKEMIKRHAEKGNTVIFSTHVLDTAQQLCDELAILKKVSWSITVPWTIYCRIIQMNR